MFTGCNTGTRKDVQANICHIYFASTETNNSTRRSDTQLLKPKGQRHGTIRRAAHPPTILAPRRTMLLLQGDVTPSDIAKLQKPDIRLSFELSFVSVVAMIISEY